jgi:hypothetical protein
VKTLFALLLALALALALVLLNIALESTYAFEALTCDTTASCLDLYITCDGECVCQGPACEVMECVGAPDTGPRHGVGLVWLAGYLILPLYALCIARISTKEGA